MKKLKISLLALTAAAAGITAASAATATPGATYSLDFKFTNNPATYWDVSTLPTGTGILNSTNASGTNVTINAFVTTESSGKIDGVAFIRALYTTKSTVVTTNPPATNTVTTPAAWSDYFATITGNINTKSGNPNVLLNVKGSGYSAASTNSPSQPAYAASAGASTLSLQYKSSGAPVLNTNIDEYLLAGNYTGTIKPGVTTFSKGKPVKVSESASLIVGRNQITDIQVFVLSLGKQATALASFGGGFGPDAIGTINTGASKYTANFRPIGGGSSSAKLTGSVGPQNLTIGTNVIGVVQSATTGTLSGKIQGQTVSATATSVTAD